MVFSDGSGLFQKIHPAINKNKKNQKLFEEHDKELGLGLGYWPPNSPDSDLTELGSAGPTNPIHGGPTFFFIPTCQVKSLLFM